MKQILFFLSIIFLFSATTVVALTPKKDTIDNKNIYQKIDTTYIENFRKSLIVKTYLFTRHNRFDVTVDSTGKTLEYSINANTNLGFGISYKGLGIDISFSPKLFGNNKDEEIFGKSRQFALSTSSNGRRFIYDIYLRLNSGFYNTKGYTSIGDSTNKLIYINQPNMINFSLGSELVYIFNNKRFSSAAPYNFTQRQIKSAGSKLLGSYFSLYAIGVDSLIIPDTLKEAFSSDVLFKNASSLSWGISFGYTHTFIFGKRKMAYANIYFLPALSVQQYFATNNLNEVIKSKVALGLPLQYRFSIGVNRKRFFLGLAAMGVSHTLNTDQGASFNYRFGNVRILYGYRFGLKKEYFTRLLK
ncbi:MAG: DUF4421 family protein [Bacteroidia bacterium]